MPPNVATGAVRSYRTVSPLPASLLTLRRFIFCCTFRRLTPPRRYLAPCPQEPGLSSTFREKCSDCPADSGRTIAACRRLTSSGFRRAADLCLFRKLERACIGLVAFRAGEPRGKRRCFARGSSLSEDVSVASSCARGAASAAARGAPSTTTVISPRVKFASLRACAASSASVPRYTVSKTLVSSRATAARRVSAKARPPCPRVIRRCDAALRKTPACALRPQVRPARARRSPSRAGRNPSKRKSFGGQAGDAERSGNGRRPGHRHHADAFLRDAANQLESRVRQQRRPRVAHQRNARARAQLFQQLVDALALVVFVQRHQRPRQPERCQQLPRPARVFRRDQFRGRKFIACAGRKVAEIADWRRDHRKTPQVRCHYNSPPRQDAQALMKAIRRMTPKKALRK